MNSLLGYLVPWLTSRVEDTATEALAFILNRSEACRGALESLVVGEERDFDFGPITKLETQVSDGDGARPDLVGFDGEGLRRLVVESKFWAALREGQANSYFGQLDETRSGALLFVAPGTRIGTLWGEIERQMTDDSGPVVGLECVETGDRIRRAMVEGSRSRLMLVSWDLLLERLAAVAGPGNSPVASDIQQLAGLVEDQDMDAFVPIQPGEFSPSLARRVRWINHLIDDAVDTRGVPEGWMSTTGLRATPQRAGYGRYLMFVNDTGVRSPLSCFLCVSFDCWATMGDTPMWLWIGSTDQTMMRQLKDQSLTVFEDVDGLWTPLHLKAGVEYHRVLDDVVDQLHKISNVVVSESLRWGVRGRLRETGR